MNYKIFASMNVAVIGTGRTSWVFVEKLAEAGHVVFLAGMNKEDKVLQSFFCDAENINLCSIEDAASQADIIIIVTDPQYVREVAYRIDDVRGKVVIDASNIPSTIEESNINTVNAIRSITGSQHVVKCFNCKEYDGMVHMFYKDEAIDMFMAGDSKKSKETLRLLTRDLGYTDCYDFGGNESISLLEEMARCMINFTSKQKNMDRIDLKLLKK